jgi:NAD(P)-dependent dehydrogenase (short-subunit alcohol dehydrogenase family)
MHEEFSMRLDMRGKVALITGGAQGLGAAEAAKLLEWGAQVVIGDVREEEGRSLVAEQERVGHRGKIAFLKMDVTEMDDWKQAVSFVANCFGALTTLINNAGFPGRPGVEATTEEGWQKTIDVDLKGSFLGIKASVPAMRKAGGGAIVNTSSTYALVASGRGSTAYSAAKGGIVMLTKAAAVEYAREKIRVNCIHPGIIDTPRNRTLPPGWLAGLLDATPMGRMASPEEIANAVLFLASDASSYMTGTSLVVDGGYTAV